MIWLAIFPVALFLFLARSIYNIFRSDLYWVPGPFLARISNVYRLLLANKAQLVDSNAKAHAKYGKFVRFGPNLVSISDPVVADQVFSHRLNFEKSELVIPWHKRVDGKAFQGIVDARDRRLHGQLKKPVANIYSMSNIVHNEAFIDDTIRLFVRRLDELFAQTQAPCAIDDWLQWFAFDVIGEMTISRKFGLLEAGADEKHVLDDVRDELEYRARVGQMPYLHFLWRGSPLYTKFISSTNKFMAHAGLIIKHRMENGSTHPERQDMMTRFREAQKAHPEIVTPLILQSYVGLNLLAGSDTTAAVMRSGIYYGIKTPGVWTRMQQELDDNHVAYPLSFKASSSLPYVEAFISETLRYFPIAGFNLERVVSPEGLRLPNGHVLQGGTIVSVNPWALHFDKDVFGADAEVFNPDRWLMSEKESEEDHQARLSRMRLSDHAWSRGPRKCMGIHIARQELWKVLPTLIGLFNMRLAKGPQHEWTVRKMFIAVQSDMDVVMEWREGKGMKDIMEPDDF